MKEKDLRKTGQSLRGYMQEAQQPQGGRTFQGKEQMRPNIDQEAGSQSSTPFEAANP